MADLLTAVKSFLEDQAPWVAANEVTVTGEIRTDRPDWDTLFDRDGSMRKVTTIVDAGSAPGQALRGTSPFGRFTFLEVRIYDQGPSRAALQERLALAQRLLDYHHNKAAVIPTDYQGGGVRLWSIGTLGDNPGDRTVPGAVFDLVRFQAATLV